VQTSTPSFKGPHLGTASTQASIRTAQAAASQKVAAGEGSLPSGFGAAKSMNQQAPKAAGGSYNATGAAPVSTGSGACANASGGSQYDAARGGGYGLDADLAAKQAANYDTGEEGKVRAWIEEITGEQFRTSPFGDFLKDGVVLCRLVNIVMPGAVKKINDSKMPFKQMENVSNFLKAARKLGVANHDCFETVDLFEQKDLMNVIKCMIALGRAVQKNPHYKGPVLGKKEASANKREFTDAQLAASRGAVPLASLGSSKNMQRTALDTSKNIGFGENSAGKSAGGIGQGVMSTGSAGIMERSALDTSKNIGFGENSAGKSAGGIGQGVMSTGSAGIMERSENSTSNNITFGQDSAGQSAGGIGQGVMSSGSHGVMDRSDISSSNNITFGNDSAK
jgi:hypothetical protein